MIQPLSIGYFCTNTYRLLGCSWRVWAYYGGLGQHLCGPISMAKLGGFMG